MTRKEISIAFLQEVSMGDVDKAYEKYIHPDFIHHNIHFKGDRESLCVAMKENQKLFPDKKYEVHHALEDGDLTVVHAKVQLNEENSWGLLHLFRFEGQKIIEVWEASQEELDEAPNQYGLF